MSKKTNNALKALAAVEDTADNRDLVREMAELLKSHLQCEGLDFSAEQDIEAALRKAKERGIISN